MVPPNHPILIGFSIINHPFWGTTIFGNTFFITYVYRVKWLTSIQKHHISTHKQQPSEKRNRSRVYQPRLSRHLPVAGGHFLGVPKSGDLGPWWRGAAKRLGPSRQDMMGIEVAGWSDLSATLGNSLELTASYRPLKIGLNRPKRKGSDWIFQASIFSGANC